METRLPSQLKQGQVVLLDGAPHLIEELHMTGAAQTKHKVHATLRHMQTGRTLERSFLETEQVTAVDLEQRTVQYSYRQGDDFIFLDSASYEDLTLTAAQIGDRHWFLEENAEYKAVFIEGRLMEVVLPEAVAMKVMETAPPQHASQSSAQKSAVLEGGLEVLVPPFIAPGEVIRVDVRHHRYLGKEHG